MRDTISGGIDVGSCSTKAVIVDGNERILGSSVVYSGTDFEAASVLAWNEAAATAGIDGSDVKSIVATGYGRKSVPIGTKTVTEISCHGRGVLRYFPGPLTVIDLGGQDNKIIKLDKEGHRVSFKMNRKCAAGTGAFLEEMALRMRLGVEDLNGLAVRADGEVALGSYCTVFSATEVLEKIKAGHPVDRIVRGLFRSVAKRVLEMDTLTDTVVLTGGVIDHNPFLAKILEEQASVTVHVPPRPQIIGALGAALYALEENGKP
ncbi:MAG: acyl-CoA dehydratase activase [Pseudomonadota bacterium]